MVTQDKSGGHFSISYWSLYYITICLISLIDFIEHLSRETSLFRDIWVNWLLFTTISTVTVCLSIFLLNKITEKTAKSEHVLLQSVCILAGGMIHIYITGPIYDLLFLEKRTLIFLFNPTSFIVGLSLFYIIRILYYFISKKLNFQD